MRKFLAAFLTEDSGAAAAEYALILAIVGAGLAVAAFALGADISSAISGAASVVATVTF